MRPALILRTTSHHCHHMKNIALPLHLQEASLLGKDGLIYASVELTTREGHALDLALREGHHEAITPAQAKRLHAEARAIAWETAAAQLIRLSIQAAKRARKARAKVPPTLRKIGCSEAAATRAIARNAARREARRRPTDTWQTTRANCS